jgi:hypothetical protein
MSLCSGIPVDSLCLAVPTVASFATFTCMASMDQSPRARVVVLGASNATKGISLIVETAERLLGTPLDVHAALGHGRSYGQNSFLICRSIQGTLGCGLWDAIRPDSSADDSPSEKRDLPLYALLTDVGNDIMYCVESDQIIAWVDECVDRLQRLGARIVMTGLPMAVIDRIGRKRYLFFRTIFFPKNPHSLEETINRAKQVQEGLRRVADTRGVPFVEQVAEWYGIDPIHLTQQARAGAWAKILSQWIDRPPDPPTVARGSVRRFLAIRTRLPEHWWLFNRFDLGMQQPCARMPSGSLVSMY